jgi:hypothetical protein
MNFKSILIWGAVVISTLAVGGAIASSTVHPTQALPIELASPVVSSQSSPTPTPSPTPSPSAVPSPSPQLHTPSPTPVASPIIKASPAASPVVVKQSTPESCDPNYSGACVPIASDVDCAGGSGNGPAYVRGPVTVIGSDIYKLDSDHDGIGCDK